MKASGRLLLAFVLAVVAGCSWAPQDRDVLYQVSTFSALLAGVLDGQVKVGELKRHGDLGIGSFEALDGEMVCLDGVADQVRGDGTVRVATDDATAPYADMTFFDADDSFALPEGVTLERLADVLNARLKARNLPLALKLTGTFSHVKARSCPAQPKPYPPLEEVLASQHVFEFRNVRGTMVGFLTPACMGGIGMPGCHLHFLTEDKSGGGHVLSFVAEQAVVEVDVTPRLELTLPESGRFLDADLSSAGAAPTPGSAH